MQDDAINTHCEDSNHVGSSTREFLQLMGRCDRQLYAFFLGATGHVSSAEDLMQETQLKLWDQFDRFERGTDFAAWAFTVARYEVLRHRRDSRKHERLLNQELIDRMASRLSQPDPNLDERLDALLGCIERLPAKHRELVEKRYHPKCSVSELAKELGKTPNALHQLLWRIRQTLQDCVDAKTKVSG